MKSHFIILVLTFIFSGYILINANEKTSGVSVDLADSTLNTKALPDSVYSTTQKSYLIKRKDQLFEKTDSLKMNDLFLRQKDIQISDLFLREKNVDSLKNRKLYFDYSKEDKMAVKNEEAMIDSLLKK